VTFRVPSPNDLPLAVRNAIEALRQYTETEDLHAPAFTTAERDALTLVAGLWIFNKDTLKFQGYDGTAWQNFH
jgi:hypothetical protein